MTIPTGALVQRARFDERTGRIDARCIRRVAVATHPVRGEHDRAGCRPDEGNAFRSRSRNRRGTHSGSGAGEFEGRDHRAACDGGADQAGG